MRFSLGKIIALCGAAAMVVPLAACGTTQSETSDGSGKTVVNVWAWDNNLKANAKVFMKKNPNIVIKFTNAGSSKDGLSLFGVGEWVGGVVVLVG